MSNIRLDIFEEIQKKTVRAVELLSKLSDDEFNLIVQLSENLMGKNSGPEWREAVKHFLRKEGDSYAPLPVPYHRFRNPLGTLYERRGEELWCNGRQLVLSRIPTQKDGGQVSGSEVVDFYRSCKPVHGRVLSEFLEYPFLVPDSWRDMKIFLGHSFDFKRWYLSGVSLSRRELIAIHIEDLLDSSAQILIYEEDLKLL